MDLLAPESFCSEMAAKGYPKQHTAFSSCQTDVNFFLLLSQSSL